MSGETSHQEHIGPYRLLSPLGGGAGAVHRAADPDGRDVAIRLLPPGTEPDLARMRAVRSPYVVDVLDGEPAGPVPYVVSRFVPGRPLDEHVAAEGPVGGAALRRMAFGLAKALAALHRQGLAHGALGPGTVLVVDAAPVVVDFGLTGGDAPADVAAWGAVVAFAAGGPDAPAGALPAELRPLVAAATDPDPGARPSAADLAEAASALDLPPVPGTSRPSGAPSSRPAPVAPAPVAPSAVPPAPAVADASGTAAVARGLAVARGWARLLAAMVVVIAVGVAVMMPIAGLALSLAAVTLLRAAAATSVRGWAWALGRTLLTVPYAAAFTVAVPLALVAASAVGGEIDPLGACAFGAGAGAAVLWTAPGVSGPRRQMERMALATARHPRGIAAAGVVLGVLALLAIVGAMSLTPSFAPMYGLQSSLESSIDRLQNAVDRM
ncbi:hypothetical protein AGRA3207_006181 [Actinomadura graeca]|uniref:Protein kinase domain-containing protein n=1 Tax=Actinomadura graeca TaxID=2750812 RepID=A0ABX8R497_9ACTN|nr:hypothetical protein [Actinomadura graeca]QXJ24787.1 hypothetical protein AGRA3207_006181 [Actinomadura graeca]